MTRPAGLAEDLLTAEEFYRLVPDGQKADLIDGVIYMASPDSRRANRLNGFVYFLIDGFVAVRSLGGEVFINRYTFQLSDVRSPEPDVAYVGPERLHLVQERAMLGGPDVAVEIVSRESRNRDYGEKRTLYEQAGVLEYWIIDPLQRRVEFLRLKNGRYKLAPLEENRRFYSQAIPGFWIDVEWLLADSPPNVYECLKEILGESPQR